MRQQNRAFTLLELIFVIVVIGVLVGVLLPRTRTNPLHEAAIQIVNDIRYVQHLAFMDDKYDAQDRHWYKGRWQIVFGHNRFSKYKWEYTVFSDSSLSKTVDLYSGDPKESEIAKNPQNPRQIMTGGYNNTAALDIRNANFKGIQRLNIGQKYGITNVRLSGGCRYGRISFDYLGRPLMGDLHTMSGAYNAPTQRLIQRNCIVTLSHGTDTIKIVITPESGYAYIQQ